jgi:hypothetical protein
MFCAMISPQIKSSQVVRYMEALRGGLSGLGIESVNEDHRHGGAVYVYGALAGPTITPEVQTFANLVLAIWPEYTNLALRFGVFDLDRLKGLTITPLYDLEGSKWLDTEADRTPVIEYLLGKDPLFGELREQVRRWSGPPDDEERDHEADAAVGEGDSR